MDDKNRKKYYLNMKIYINLEFLRTINVSALVTNSSY